MNFDGRTTNCDLTAVSQSSFPLLSVLLRHVRYAPFRVGGKGGTQPESHARPSLRFAGAPVECEINRESIRRFHSRDRHHPLHNPQTCRLLQLNRGIFTINKISATRPSRITSKPTRYDFREAARSSSPSISLSDRRSKEDVTD